MGLRASPHPTQVGNGKGLRCIAEAMSPYSTVTDLAKFRG